MNQLFALILAAVHVSVQPAPVGPFTLTADRLWANLAVVLALIGVVSGGLALARSAGNRRNRAILAILAIVAGLIAAIIGGLLLATADGGPGAGNGVVGAFIALVLGLIAVAEGGLFLFQSRRVG